MWLWSRFCESLSIYEKGRHLEAEVVGGMLRWSNSSISSGSKIISRLREDGEILLVKLASYHWENCLCGAWWKRIFDMIRVVNCGNIISNIWQAYPKSTTWCSAYTKISRTCHKRNLQIIYQRKSQYNIAKINNSGYNKIMQHYK